MSTNSYDSTTFTYHWAGQTGEACSSLQCWVWQPLHQQPERLTAPTGLLPSTRSLPLWSECSPEFPDEPKWGQYPRIKQGPYLLKTVLGHQFFSHCWYHRVAVTSSSSFHACRLSKRSDWLFSQLAPPYSLPLTSAAWHVYTDRFHKVLFKHTFNF